MKILITGTSSGIGKRVSERYLSLGHEVYGLDILPTSIKNERYHHYQVGISNKNVSPFKPAYVPLSGFPIALIEYIVAFPLSGWSVHQNINL